jgi:ERF superfamily
VAGAVTWPAERPASLAEALAALQRRLPDVRKGETATVRSDKGVYSYRYASLADISAAVLPLLGELGLSFTCRPTLAGDRFVLAYRLLHISGEALDGEYPLPSTGTPQQLGSALTYARRYCLSALVGLAPDEDDDGAAASSSSTSSTASSRTRPSRRRPAVDEPVVGTPPTDAALNKLFALLRQGGWVERQPTLDYCASVIGRPIQSRNELTRAEVDQLITSLAAALAEPTHEEVPT